jgi:hypothetical protein
MCSYEAKILKNSNNFIKLQCLMHPTYVLRKISIVEYSYLFIPENSGN